MDPSRMASPARLAILLVLLPLAGCGPDYSPNTYASSAAQQANKVDQGIVVGVRRVDIRAQTSTGAVTGGAVGGIAGSQAPGSGVVSAIGARGGSLIGGILGSTVEQTAIDSTAYEYVVRKPNGELISVTQKDESPLGIGQNVLVIAGSQARIVADYTVAPPAPPAVAPAQPAVVVRPLSSQPPVPRSIEPEKSEEPPEG
jgi:outer membrane lipoprotein SlyB